jgi:hypothetical protein
MLDPPQRLQIDRATSPSHHQQTINRNKNEIFIDARKDLRQAVHLGFQPADIIFGRRSCAEDGRGNTAGALNIAFIYRPHVEAQSLRQASRFIMLIEEASIANPQELIVFDPSV